MTWQKTDDASMACIRVLRDAKGAFTPETCDQCGLRAEVCPAGAITQNAKRVYTIDKSLCLGCGLCAETCPKGLIVYTPELTNPAKCVACGLCVRACPRDVLAIAEG